MQPDKLYALRGFLFQMVLITTFLARTLIFSKLANPPVVVSMIDFIGMGIFGWCFYDLYVRRHRLTGLITTGVFKYTRHPMYTGLFLMDLQFWFVKEYGPFFLLSTILLYSSIIIAAYFQERETVARFGDEAVNYYRKTPRLFLLYPIYR